MGRGTEPRRPGATVSEGQDIAGTVFLAVTVALAAVALQHGCQSNRPIATPESSVIDDGPDLFINGEGYPSLTPF